MTPTIRAFREAFPRARLAALVNAGTEEMLTGSPLLDEVLVSDPGWKSLPFPQRAAREWEFARQVRKRKFDLAVNLTEGDRGAFLCLASGAGTKVGVYHPRGLWWRSRLYDCLVRPRDWKAHTVEQMLEVPRSLGLEVRDRRVEIFFSEEDRAAVDRLLEDQGVGPADLLVHIHPTSRWLFKCWRDEGVAAVVDALQGSGKARVVLTGGGEEREREKISRILGFCRSRPVDLSGKITLKQLAALSRRSRLFLGVDTAPMHIAAAVGTPVIALFGPSGEFNWGPWGEGHAVIKRDWECRPCGRDGCQGSKRSRCLEEITEEEVLQVVFKKLSEPAPGGGLSFS